VIYPDAFRMLGLFLQSPHGAALAALTREQASAVIGLAVAADHIDLEMADADDLDEMADALPGVWSDTSWLAETIAERKAEIEDEVIGRLDLDLPEDEDEQTLAQQLVAEIPDGAVAATMTLMAYLGYDPDAGGLNDDYVAEQIAFLAEHRDGPDPEEAIERGIEARTGGVPGAMSLGEIVEETFEPDEADPLALHAQVTRMMIGIGELPPDAEVPRPSPESPTYSLLLSVSDHAGWIIGWAVPDSLIGAEERAALEAVSRRYFGFWFCADMPQEAWPGVLLITALTGSRGASAEQFQQALEEFESYFDKADLPLDTDAMAKRLDQWNPHRIDLTAPESFGKTFSSVTVFREGM
jgi:hypothetical protein